MFLPTAKRPISADDAYELHQAYDGRRNQGEEAERKPVVIPYDAPPLDAPDAVLHMDPHTACVSYEVAPQHCTEPLPHHRRYLALENERQHLDVQLERLEREGALSKEAEALYEQLFRRFTAIVEEQRRMRDEADETKATAA